MSLKDVTQVSRRRKRKVRSETSSYTFRDLVDDVPLLSSAASANAEITCVEILEGNLYIGTSLAEILHFVLFPNDSESRMSKPNFILASRLQPTFNLSSSSPQSTRGVQQILLLPAVNKACILCNGTLSFYSLPELTPAFGNTKVSNCGWVGGLDLNKDDGGGFQQEGIVIMVSIKNRIRLVRIGEEPRLVRNIEFSGCLSTVRRDNFACVADAWSYSLLDVDHQQKIPLFPISSLDQSSRHGHERASDYKSALPENSQKEPSGSLLASTGSLSLGPESSSNDERRTLAEENINRQIPAALETRATQYVQPSAYSHGEQLQDTAHDPASVINSTKVPSPNKKPAQDIKEPLSKFIEVESIRPHIVSPTPTEFLLTTGTDPSEPGVGMFVNLDGDVVRGTLEFSRYPEGIILDGKGIDFVSGANDENAEEGYVLAVIGQDSPNGKELGLEIQRWDVGLDEGGGHKEWVSMADILAGSNEYDVKSYPPSVGIRRTIGRSNVFIEELRDKLQVARINIDGLHSTVEGKDDDHFLDSKLEHSSFARDPANDPDRGNQRKTYQQENDPTFTKNLETLRNEEERQFIERLSYISSQTILWSGNKVWWIVRNPLAMRLDSLLEDAMRKSDFTTSGIFVDLEAVIQILHSVRGQDPKTELEFLSLNYIKQKSGLLLLTDMISRLLAGVELEESFAEATEEALIEGNVDPRIVLSLIPGLRENIVHSEKGIWAFSGVRGIIVDFFASAKTSDISLLAKVASDAKILGLLKRYLSFWRKKKGFGSVSDENEIFQTVDASLLHVLLILDERSPKGPAAPSSLRAELNSLVDQGIECLQRAVTLIESYHRLYILSRLYQSRKMAGHVLHTWRRILEGEADEGGELLDGEYEMRKYLLRIRDSSLVKEYGLWLAQRNVQLGISVFTDSSSRVKFESSQVIELLRHEAPLAVQEYLEYLVFVQQDASYAYELIFNYIDNITDVLKKSDAVRSSLVESYETYRALRQPKPTYRHFVEENYAHHAWWRNRLRFLQLLGGTDAFVIQYDVRNVIEKIEPFGQELVPEIIILYGRQGYHKQALRLLTHTLADYDTAVNYCLLGGSSIFRTLPWASAGSIASQEEQATLFGYLLNELLEIQDITDRIEQTGQLLDRFGQWFDANMVLSKIPDTWSVDLLSGFLVSALQHLVSKRNESMITKALSASENLRATAEYIERCRMREAIMEKAD